MDYSKLIIKKEFLGKTLNTGVKNIPLTEDLSAKDKAYLYNLVTKNIFVYGEDIENSIEVTKSPQSKTIKVINVKNIAKPNTRKPGRPAGSKNKTAL